MRGQGQLHFARPLGKGVRAGSLPGLGDGDNPSEEQAGAPPGGSEGMVLFEAGFAAGLGLIQCQPPDLAASTWSPVGIGHIHNE